MPTLDLSEANAKPMKNKVPDCKTPILTQENKFDGKSGVHSIGILLSKINIINYYNQTK